MKCRLVGFSGKLAKQAKDLRELEMLGKRKDDLAARRDRDEGHEEAEENDSDEQ